MLRYIHPTPAVGRCPADRRDRDHVRLFYLLPNVDPAALRPGATRRPRSSPRSRTASARTNRSTPSSGTTSSVSSSTSTSLQLPERRLGQEPDPRSAAATISLTFGAVVVWLISGIPIGSSPRSSAAPARPLRDGDSAGVRLGARVLARSARALYLRSDIGRFRSLSCTAPAATQGITNNFGSGSNHC